MITFIFYQKNRKQKFINYDYYILIKEKKLKMKCPECNGESAREDVCTNCGLVVIEKNIVNRPTKSMKRILKEGRYRNVVQDPHSPDFLYSHVYPKNSRNPLLRRAFKTQIKKVKKDVKDYYVKAHAIIEKYCSILNLTSIIKNEALSIYKYIINKDGKFFYRYGAKPSYLAFIKIAAKIHEFPITNRQFMEMIDYKYKIKEGQTMAYMDKKFNKAYVMTKKLLSIHFKIPVHPKYIDYVCESLKLPYRCARAIHRIFTIIKGFFKFPYKLEGYLLALYYITFKKDFNITLVKLEELFGISRITISSRKKELLKVMKNE